MTAAIIFKKLLLLSVIGLLLISCSSDKKSPASDAKDEQQSHKHVQTTPQSLTDEGETAGGKKKIKYWVAPMDPTYIRDKPGKSPMGMDLIPVYEDDDRASDAGVISIDPVTVQNMGIRTAAVSLGPLNATIRTIGTITYDEALVEHIHTKISGWVEHLYINTTGETVRKGERLLSVYSPELVTTQEEYLQALRYQEKVASSSFEEVVRSADSLAEAARKRLLFMDIDSQQIQALEQKGKVQKSMDLLSPANGIVIKKNVIDGMKVDPGMELYTLADLSRVWVIASIYEYELPFLKVGQEAEMRLTYEPGARYHGRITFIYPYLSSKTRTVQVRMEFDNPDLKLKPDMYTDVIIKTKLAEETLRIPSESVIKTGARNIVITTAGEGKFLPKEITTGPEGEGYVQALAGLKEGEVIVTSGQFLIDSESNLREAINRMIAAKSKPAEPEQTTSEPIQHKMEMGTSEARNEAEHPLIPQLIGIYLKMHSALVAESLPDVIAESRTMSGILEKMIASVPEGNFRGNITAMHQSIQGMSSKDLSGVRNAFKSLSRHFVEVVKGPGRADASSEGIRIFYCPMEKERWLQKGDKLENPYLGKNMLLCGTEETY